MTIKCIVQEFNGELASSLTSETSQGNKHTLSQKERKRRGGSNGGRCEMLDSIRSTRGQREIITRSFCSFFSKAFFMSCHYYIKRSNCFVTGLLHNGYSYDLFNQTCFNRVCEWELIVLVIAQATLVLFHVYLSCLRSFFLPHLKAHQFGFVKENGMFEKWLQYNRGGCQQKNRNLGNTILCTEYLASM